MSSLKNLVQARGTIRGKLTRMISFNERCDNATTIEEIEERLAVLPSILKQYEDIQNTILTSDGVFDDDAIRSEHEKLHEVFETDWYQVKAALNARKASKTKSLQTAPAQNNDKQFYNVKLPEISLVEFNGTYAKWLPFHNSFNSLIHENSSLSGCAKLHYLKSALKGDALKAIESIEISDANYIVAWNLLKGRFQNKRLIVNDHVRSILNIAEVRKASSSSLYALLNELKCHREGLKSFSIPIDQWDAIIVPIISKKFDYETLRQWENTLDDEVPTQDHLVTFLEKRCRFLEALSDANFTSKCPPPPAPIARHPKIAYGNNYSTKFKSSHVATEQRDKFRCYVCNQSHSIDYCPEFLRLSIGERLKKANSLLLCQNCLRKNHTAADCRSRTKCAECDQSGHNSLLHIQSNRDDSVSTISSTESGPNVATHCFADANETVLSTAIVLVANDKGQWIPGRALLDPGSQVNFASEAFVKQLGLKTAVAKIKISGISTVNSEANQVTRLRFRSRIEEFEATMTCSVIEKITQDLPSTSIKNIGEISPDLPLADPKFFESSAIDLLIGAELFWQLLLNEKIKIGDPSLFLTHTRVGWVVGGARKLKSKTQLAVTSCNHAIVSPQDQQLNATLSKFWEQEEIPHKQNNWTAEEIACEEHFQQTYKRNDDGRFVVRLPFKNEEKIWSNSSELALRRFSLLEKRFSKDHELKSQYSAVMREYLDLGHMELVPDDEIENERSYYLPHHAVFKTLPENSVKTRVVFDATAGGNIDYPPLNKTLMVGPVIQDDLLSILLRFRSREFVFTADIKHMYRQILVDQRDIDFQRLFWRFHQDEPVKIYRLNRVTFGLSSSSFLAVRCIQQLARDVESEYPDASLTIQKDTYVDDVIVACGTLEKALKLQNAIKNIFAQGGFELAKWSANHPALLSIAAPDDVGANVVNLSKNGISKTLGVFWDRKTDNLLFKATPIDTSGVITKRKILSNIAALYDPMGLIAPVVLKAKLLMQVLWADKNLGWDDEVSSGIRHAWEQFAGSLHCLNNVSIPRHASIPNPVTVDICAFADASIKAFGACVYLRASDSLGNVQSRLMASKSRVAPVKVVSLPRLELCGALLSVQLMLTVQNALRIPILNRYLFSDSTIVLHWIASPANVWQTYVSNRVGEIQRNTNKEEWHHVNTRENPADHVSRGLEANQLEENTLCFNGPKWLIKGVDEWITIPLIEMSTREFPDELAEKRKTVLATMTITPAFEALEGFASFDKLQRVIAYCLRFVNDLRSPKTKIIGRLTVEELKDSHDRIIRHIQNLEFQSDIKRLKAPRNLSKGSKLRSLDPFVAENGILRVGGRIKFAVVPYDRKFPIILPKHHVTDLIIRREHVSNLHAGAHSTLASLRAKYWPLSGKSSVRKIIRNCVRCFRVTPRTIDPKMGDLPKARVQPSGRAFVNTGLDYFGPLFVKQGSYRSAKLVKSYGALFVCMATKAVHLELVSDLSSESFLNAFRRFISRRGNVAKIFCDNATNFARGEKDLKEAASIVKDSQFREDFQQHFKSVEFKFIPPRAPNFGGLWERLIRSVKLHIKRVLGNSHLTFEEMYTLLCRIESILNSRPLTPLSDDVHDFQVLTPGHFLVFEPLTAPVEPDHLGIPENRLNRWQRIEQLRQHFWRRWHREVLSEMQTRAKWRNSPADQFRPGAMVLIAEDGIPPLMWKLGRILELHLGSDQVARVATIQTAGGGILKRSTRKICVLPIEEAAN